MIQSFIFKLLMAPFALLYGVGISLHNGLYNVGILRGLDFSLPVISIGNLTIGGSGKTPHVEYLIGKLSPYLKTSVLSRGYRRKTKGMKYVSTRNNAFDVGDEPLSYKRKFPETSVVVSESRAFAIPQMVASDPELQVILLDDAYQHRAVNPGLNILLTEYDRPFFKDHLLPVGRLREWRSAYKRADIIIVSKCPNQLSKPKMEEFIQGLDLLPEQKLFFSKYNYKAPYFLFNPNQKIKLSQNLHVILLCAIARTEYLVKYLKDAVNSYDTIEYEDHHYYNGDDIKKVNQLYNQIPGKQKIILTTEKDATRLELLYPMIKDLKLPIFVLPIEVQFLNNDEELFDLVIQQHLLDFEV